MKLFDTETSLHIYVCHFTPDIWVVNISNVAYVPLYTKEQYEKMKQGIYPYGTEWYLKQAIESFFKELHEQNRTHNSRLTTKKTK